MFTVKHVSPDGSEFAIEAESYLVEHDKDQNIVRLFTFDSKFRTPDYTGLWAGRPLNERRPQPPETIYVMNRYGATITKLEYEALAA